MNEGWRENNKKGDWERNEKNDKGEDEEVEQGGVTKFLVISRPSKDNLS